MIKTEFFTVRFDGVELYRTYSDEGYYITRDDEVFEEAIDPVGYNRVYTELRMEDKIPDWKEPTDEEDTPEEPFEEA